MNRLDKKFKLNPLSHDFIPKLKKKLNPLANIFYPKLYLGPESEDQYSNQTFYNFSKVDCFYTFCLFNFTLSFCFYAALFSIELLDNETQSPVTILRKLRKANIDRIIIGHLNINSIRNKIHNLADIVSNRIDILLITETKIDHTFPRAQFLIESYSEPLRLDRSAFGGGLLLYIRKDIAFKKLELKVSGIECIFSEITISKKKWLLIGFYNPDKSLIAKNISILEENVSHYLNSYDNILILGDFNAESTNDTMTDFASAYHLKNLIKSPTCFKSCDNPSCIDLILTNKPRSFQNSSILETGLSDFHLLTFTVLKTTYRKRPPKVIRYRDYKKYSFDSFQKNLESCLSKINLSTLSNDGFHSLLLQLVNSHAPQKTKYLRGNDQPFMNKQLRKAHMKRTMLLNKFRKNNTEYNLLAFKKQRNYCVKLLRETKKSYFGNLEPSDIANNKRFWKTVKPLFSDKTVTSDDILLTEGEDIISDSKTIAEIFGSFFSNAVKNLNIENSDAFCNQPSKIIHDDPVRAAIEKHKQHPSIIKIKECFPCNEKFTFQKTNLEEITKEIRNLVITKAFPIDSVPPIILKNHIKTISPKIEMDFNKAIEDGIFPQNMKLADVTPLFKKEDKHLKGNYRPVSILSSISKVFERLMRTQINEFMENKLSIFLCGYRKGMGAQNCLLYLVNKWKLSLDRSDKCGILFTDLSKAFDCLSHELLIAKLDSYGFDYSSLKLIYNYLSNRFQRVRVDSDFSTWTKILTGVPQGSILGPDLYNFNSNDLFLFLTLDICNFADDNSPFTTAPNISSVLQRLTSESKLLLDWIKNNQLKANPDKFHLILSEKDESISINVAGFEIENQLSAKLLGIKIDSKLTFDEHVSNLCFKASQKLHALARIRSYMSIKQSKILMKTFILSHFGYCPLIWMMHSRTLNNRINKIHERALRLVYKDDVSSFSDLLKKDNSFTIHERNIQSLAIELFKVVNRISPKIMEHVFPLKETLRYPNENPFVSFKIRTVSWGDGNLAYFGPKIWQIIPQEIRNESNLSLFKKKIRQWKPINCPCRICKNYVPCLGFI